MHDRPFAELVEITSSPQDQAELEIVIKVNYGLDPAAHVASLVAGRQFCTFLHPNVQAMTTSVTGPGDRVYRLRFARPPLTRVDYLGWLDHATGRGLLPTPGPECLLALVWLCSEGVLESEAFFPSALYDFSPTSIFENDQGGQLHLYADLLSNGGLWVDLAGHSPRGRGQQYLFGQELRLLMVVPS